MVKIVLPPLIVLTDSQGNWGRRSGRLSVGQALAVMRLGGTSHAQRFALARGVGVGRAVGRAKSPIGRVLGVGRARPLGCWAGRLAPSGPGPDVGRRREMSGVGRCFSMALPVVWKCFSLVGSSFSVVVDDRRAGRRARRRARRRTHCPA